MAQSTKATERHLALPEGATITLEMDGSKQTVPVERKQFKSGSIGYFAQLKVPGQSERRYQVQLTATLIGSKPDA